MKGHKVHLRADKANGVHTTFTVFMNGGNCGQLTMRDDEAVHFYKMLESTSWKIPEDEFRGTGKWGIEKDN